MKSHLWLGITKSLTFLALPVAQATLLFGICEVKEKSPLYSMVAAQELRAEARFIKEGVFLLLEAVEE